MVREFKILEMLQGVCTQNIYSIFFILVNVLGESEFQFELELILIPESLLYKLLIRWLSELNELRFSWICLYKDLNSTRQLKTFLVGLEPKHG